MNVLVIKGMTLPELSDADRERIAQAAGPDSIVKVAADLEEAVALAGDAEAILGYIPKPLFDAAPQLRWVHTISAGVDAFLYPEMRDGDVLLTGEKGLVGSHLAETGFGLLFALTRRIQAARLDAPNSWEHRLEYRREETELDGATMGIVGFGGVGRAFAKRAVAFGMDCLALDIEDVPPADEVAEVWRPDRFHELLERSDVVTVGLPLTDATRGIFDAEAFARMKSTAHLVNVTRGEVVDGAALVEALRTGEIAGAALDVQPQEPLPPAHPLWTLPNVAMTPHTAGASQLRAGRNLDRFCANLRHLREGEPLEGQIDKHKGY
jgi:phosphoglycerate dehydrogenase-like enzyme